jgi:hypothetical protein
MRTDEGPFPDGDHLHLVSDRPTSTHMTLGNCGEPAGFSKVIAPFMVPAMRRANRKDLARIKTIFESAESGHDSPSTQPTDWRTAT